MRKSIETASLNQPRDRSIISRRIFSLKPPWTKLQIVRPMIKSQFFHKYQLRNPGDSTENGEKSENCDCFTIFLYNIDSGSGSSTWIVYLTLFLILVFVLSIITRLMGRFDYLTRWGDRGGEGRISLVGLWTNHDSLWDLFCQSWRKTGQLKYILFIQIDLYVFLLSLELYFNLLPKKNYISIWLTGG